jgi:AcrR family transcriptional regulator
LFFYSMVVLLTRWPAGAGTVLTNPDTAGALLEQRRHRKMTACRRFVPLPSNSESLLMAKPLIPVDVIYEHALALIDAEGAQALNARRLAADLRCSTRTLYQQVGNREELIRALIDRHFSQLQLDFHEYDSWESTAVQWSLALDEALQAHPFLTELMNVDDRGAVTSYVDKLLKSLVQAGIDRRIATDCCRSLVNTTINHAIVEAQALRQVPPSRAGALDAKKRQQSYLRTIDWIVAGVRQEVLSGLATSRRR